MNERFKSLIARYLKKEDKPPYALLINGKWGSGKTWYFKNQFEEHFEGKKVIYVSAHGMQSLDDLSQQIMYRKLMLNEKIVKNPTAKVAWSLAKHVTKSVLDKKFGIDVDDIKMKIDFNDFASLTKDEVLIIDDIERIDDSIISYQELFGYVSTNFTEENGFKVLMVADESKIFDKYTTEDDKDNKLLKDKYLSIKEKTIWQTIDYELDYDAIFENLLEGYSTHVQTQIIAKKGFIIGQLIKYDVKNLRLVLYYLECVNELIESCGKVFCEPHFDILLNSLLILVIEFKYGRIKKLRDEDIPKYLKAVNLIDLYDNHSVFLTTEEDDSCLHKMELFEKRYHLRNSFDYCFIVSLYYLVGYGEFEQEELVDEILKVKESMVVQSEWEKCLTRMSKIEYLEYDERESSWKELLEYISEDRYGIDDLKTIAGIYTKYVLDGDRLPITDNELFELLLKALEIKVDDNSILNDLFFRFHHKLAYNSKQYADFIKLANTKKSTFDSKMIKSTVNKSLELFHKTSKVSPNTIFSIFIFGQNSDIENVVKKLSNSVKLAKTFECFLVPMISQLLNKSLIDPLYRNSIAFKKQIYLEKQSNNIQKNVFGNLHNFIEKNIIEVIEKDYPEIYS